MNSSIKNLVFDFGGVLIDIDKERCIDAFRNLGFEQAERLIGNYCQQGIFSDLELGRISSEVFCQSVRNDSGRLVSDEQIIQAWNSMLVGIDPAKLGKLLELRQTYRVYLLSNTNIIHWKSSIPMFTKDGHSLNDYFDDLFLSFEMHQAKPDKEIFQSVISRAGIMPHETLLIDDSETNCNAVRSLGWQAHRVEAGTSWMDLF